MFGTQRNETTAFHSTRSMAIARRGMICTSQTLASEAALQILRSGGNAIDAAICAAAVLGVVEPFSTGIGGDCFMLIWRPEEHHLFGLNGSGRAPEGLTAQLVRERGHQTMPMHGMLPVTIPGAVHAWGEALQRFGTKSFAEVLAPAIEYAEDGFPVSEIIAHQWNLIAQVGILAQADAQRTFTIDGRAPRLGEVMRVPALAESMRRIAAGGAAEFYEGDLARRIVEFSQANGGVHTLEDFRQHTSTWVDPIWTDYRGYTLFEMPPNGQGITALMALNILENFDVVSQPLGSAASLHLRIEAVKLAFADRDRFIADPERARVPVDELLSKDYAHGRAAIINPSKALKGVQPGNIKTGDTVYLTTADAQGNVVSLINSLYLAFGSGMVAGDTGIALHNRGFGFVLEPGHPNVVAPGKRPFHTIIPAMLFQGEQPRVSFGIMGGDQQAQAHVQVVSNLVDYGLNIQEALDYPRFHYLDTDRVSLEPEYDAAALNGLRHLGHDLVDPGQVILRGGFGGGQGIMIDPATGAYWGGSDRRKDGCAIGF